MTASSERSDPTYKQDRGSPEPIEGRCAARLRKTDPPRYCTRWPLRGASRCKTHGAKAPQAKAAAARTLAESKVRTALHEFGVREVENPLAELQALTAEVLSFKDWAARHVASLGDSIRYRDAKDAEQLRAEVQVYERALDRAGKFLEMWARLGLDSMLAALQVRVTEAQTAALSRGLDAYRAAAGVEGEAHQAGLAAMAKALRS